MKNLYFDRWELKQIVDNIDINPYEAKIKLEDYLSRYPNDYSARIYYSFALCKLGQFNDSEEALNQAISLANNNETFLNKSKSLKIFKELIIMAKLRLLSYQGRFDELFKFYLEHIDDAKELDLNRTIFYCRKKIGKLDMNRREKNSYIFRQTVEYKESDFLEHIKKHLADYNKDVDEPNDCVFVSSFPLHKVLEEIKKYIPSDKRIFPGDYDNLYIFKFDSCGRISNKSVDYIKVVCFHDTSDIITMYPSNDCGNLPYVDLNYLSTIQRSDPKAKRLSQTEKFNKRFQLK